MNIPKRKNLNQYLRLALLKIVILTVFMANASSAWPHEDVSMPIQKDGTFKYLPDIYGPAKLEVKFSNNPTDPPINYVSLKLGENENIVPSCITDILPAKKMSEIYAAGSWYHDEKYTPYYIILKFRNYSLLFNLRTAKLIQMDFEIERLDKNGTELIPVDLKRLCGE